MNISKRELFRFEKKTEGFLPDDFGFQRDLRILPLRWQLARKGMGSLTLGA